MESAIILLILVVILAFALKETIRHFKGQGACCGGGSGSRESKIPKKKLSGTVIGKKTVRIEGMHCENCVKSVTKAINQLEGASAKVSLKEKKAVVSYDRPLDNEKLKKAVENAGFKVVSIEA
ncbi:MAG TPA: heavy-metal-associated domain-containing protein [Candidatus Choladousia intestinavium]|uniref:Heavy-metal-associated domain-containing protein n=1 Tax=Candidatus Choladousia intestinavium TaxID=2840727 RepID=A0A9D1AD10_9FIRM|nr:heavy-metal-associated domain-containing protein [Candidatus Choladousia intestinavium]